MNRIKNVVHEVLGLFVDDASFALAILIWLGIARWGVSHLSLAPTTLGIILFAGLILILCENVTRYARRSEIRENNTRKDEYDVH